MKKNVMPDVACMNEYSRPFKMTLMYYIDQVNQFIFPKAFPPQYNMNMIVTRPGESRVISTNLKLGRYRKMLRGGVGNCVKLKFTQL